MRVINHQSFLPDPLQGNSWKIGNWLGIGYAIKPKSDTQHPITNPLFNDETFHHIFPTPKKPIQSFPPGHANVSSSSMTCLLRIASALGDPFVRGLHDFGQVVVGDLRISTVVTGVALVGGTRWIGDVMGL